MRTTAFNDLRKGQLDKAMQNIEPTISDPSTMNDPKTWFYRGNIYLQIHMSENPEYKSLDANALTKAYESYKRLLELDTKRNITPKLFKIFSLLVNSFIIKVLNVSVLKTLHVLFLPLKGLLM